MALKEEEREIGGVRYRVTQLLVTPGKDLLFRLGQILGPVFARGLQGEAVDLENINVSGMIAEFFDRAKAEDFDKFCSVLAKQTQFSPGEGKWVPLTQEWEFHFAGRYEHLLQWLKFALEVQFGGFSSGLASLLGGGGGPGAAFRFHSPNT